MENLIAVLQRQLALSAVLWLVVLVGIFVLCIWLMQYGLAEHRKEQNLWRRTIEKAAGVRRTIEPEWSATVMTDPPVTHPGVDAPEGYVWVLVKREDLEARPTRTG